MKKALLSTTAIVAAGVIAAPANAADRIKLSLGGYTEQFIGFADAEEDTGVRDIRAFDTQNDSEVYFSGNTTLDNGIKIGVRFELEAGANDNTGVRGGGTEIDEAWMDISGSFGALRIGQDDMVNGQTQISGPRGIGGDYDNWVTATNITKTDSAYFTTGGDSNRVSYFTPRVWGLQAAVAYRPEIGAGAVDAGNAPANSLTDPGSEKAFSVSYKGEVSGVGIDLVYGYAHDTGRGTGRTATSCSAEGHGVGAQFKYGGFTVGGGVRMADDCQTINDAGVSLSGTSWMGGISYATGPITIGFWHLTSEAEGTYTSTAAGVDEDETDANLVFFDYKISDGVQWRSFVFHVDYDEESNVDANEAGGGWGVVGGLKLDF
jgi:hypothetical protein